MSLPNRFGPFLESPLESRGGVFALLITLGLAVIALLKIGIMGAAALLLILPVYLTVRLLIEKPILSVYGVLILAFLNTGLSRYAALPWGLMIDGLLLFGWLTFVFKWQDQDWGVLKNAFFLWSLAWFMWVCLQLLNPLSLGPLPWFYAMRSVGFYQMLLIGLLLLFIRSKEQYMQLIWPIILLSVLGTIWGFKQEMFGLDSAEYKWLYVDGYAMTHVLHGVLRVFSFYSDAGQFGAAQALMFTISGILMIGPFPTKHKIVFGIVAVLSLMGFGMSGTRGALAVPAAGGVIYLIVSKNIKILSLGAGLIGVVYYILKYTFILQGVEQVRRMRTALDPNDASLLVRIENQKIFAAYLRDKPLGGGIGSVGYWGNRFAPKSFLASMPSDSYYVKIWVEMGVVGLALHLLMLGFFIGRCGYIVWHLKDPQLKQICAAMYAGFCGVLLASYGNQVFAQTPSSIICFVALALISLAPKVDSKLVD